MSSSGTPHHTARHRSGRWVMATPTSRPPLDRPSTARRPSGEALVDEPVGGGVEVVEHVLLGVPPPGVVPGLALLEAAAQPGDGIQTAGLAPCRDLRRPHRRLGDGEAAIAVEDRRHLRAGVTSRRWTGTARSACRRATGTSPGSPTAGHRRAGGPADHGRWIAVDPPQRASARRTSRRRRTPRRCRGRPSGRRRRQRRRCPRRCRAAPVGVVAADSVNGAGGGDDSRSSADRRVGQHGVALGDDRLPVPPAGVERAPRRRVHAVRRRW